MYQPKLSQAIQALKGARDTVHGTIVPAGEYFFRYTYNKRLALSAIIFTQAGAEEYTNDDIVAAVVFRVSRKWQRIVEVDSAWVDVAHPRVPFSTTVVNYCTAVFKTWIVPFGNTFDVSPFSLVPRDRAFLYDYATGLLISDWEIAANGVVTLDGTYHPSKAIVGIVGTDPAPPALQVILSSNIAMIK